MRLFLCEKPSQGKDIGRILGATQRGQGCLNGSGVTITWCIGHLVEAAAPEVYDAALKRWSLEQLPIIPQQWRVEVKPKTATQFKVVKALLAKATHLVIATDADREGELIAREIIDLCGYRGPIERLWLSALNDASIRTALGKLRPSSDTLPMYYSALARSRADWLVGMNLSRLFTLLGRQAGYDGVLSVGRVQTPTLKLVVDRDREIAAFKSVPFWAIDVSLSAEGQAFAAQWVAPDDCTDDAGRCLQQPVAQQAAQQIRAAGSAQVVSVGTERVREGPPLLFDLSTLQEVCSRQVGLDVQETLQIAQALYETHKATTYPRSDSGYLPESMFAEVPIVLDSLLNTDPSLRPIMGQLDRSQRSRAWNDGKVTAHHGIIPTLEPANLSALSEKELAVYRLIRAHYLAQFLPHHEFDRTVAEFSCGQQTLVATGKQVVVKGWRLVLAEPQADEDGDDTARSQVLPPLREGLACQVAEVEIKALKTMPAKPYTQGELVKSMKGIARFVTDPRLKQKLKDTTGIGTEATRANIISVLIARGYIVKKGRSIRASDAAFTLIDAVPAAIADPGTTAVWEQALDMIEAGQLTLDVFLSKQAAWISQLIAQYGCVSLSIKLPHGPACPQCGAATRQRTGKSGPFWSCSRYPDCKGTLPVESGTPKRGASRSRSSGRKGA
ncbi:MULTISPECIES: DNA topoisomerase III [Stutzerimonas stutzeri group]|jgi:DNA topoisomerase-3|uniref:DNA topoisomerase n=1 Tax=Stutzerimonas stutzeri TaxID=316 RepID=A0A0D7EBM4_STUST|nr:MULTISPECIES: DNA topoisomerase III [Stutzerimonas stutzeri group]KIZ38138.1 DNA topoisomerase III [Stutzerimonas stutzeri]MBK3757532.1 DNA topoisomerase III [Stutzerimonas frequens]MBK3872661.1 DNA topoisomerase III [Stutzerimonas frequens]MBK3910932.1 DNA topoisomerase III [Stutzerimonas frequens]MBK3930214.1 DNA topoisomerase III [Stutzerimonas frequens]|tara:strand:+ start:4962 stop:6974 length:2013 start_codon:yes stop_codon:yes gene_type:complete